MRQRNFINLFLRRVEQFKENIENRNHSMASNKEIITVSSMNYEKQNELNAINRKNWNKRLFTWKAVFICVINGKWFPNGFNSQFVHLVYVYVHINETFQHLYSKIFGNQHATTESL